MTGHDGIVILTEIGPADGNGEFDCGCFTACLGMIGKRAGADHAARAAGFGQVSHFI
ncbi:hypothetical protein D3C80_506110 [compost metagenome]